MDNPISKFDDEKGKEIERQIATQKAYLEMQKVSEDSLKVTLSKTEQIVGFVGTKLTGIGSIGFGISELISPDFLTIHTDNPLAYIATGLAFLTGKKIIEIVNKISKSLQDEL